MINFKTISKIFSSFLDNKATVSDIKLENRLVYLIRSSIETNWRQWQLEDSSRTLELGSKHIADAKRKIDKSNQVRNDLITAIDVEIAKQMKPSRFNNKGKFYSESPGMIIDRLAILHIKLSVIRDLLMLIKEKDLKEEYKEKERVILKQIKLLGNFIDDYFKKIKHKEVFFEVQQPVKIYNDTRTRKYLNVLQSKKKKGR